MQQINLHKRPCYAFWLVTSEQAGEEYTAKFHYEGFRRSPIINIFLHFSLSLFRLNPRTCDHCDYVFSGFRDWDPGKVTCARKMGQKKTCNRILEFKMYRFFHKVNFVLYSVFVANHEFPGNGLRYRCFMSSDDSRTKFVFHKFAGR